MQVTQLWRYPVKSMVGERVDTVRLDELGVVGDRTWAVRDLERGGIRGAKKIAALMRCSARAAGEGVVAIDLPDGSTVTSSDADLDDRLTEALGHQVRLEALRPATDLDHFKRGAPDSDDMLTELRGIFGREDDEPLPDLSVFPPSIIEHESPPGTYYDAFPLMVMSESALGALRDALPGSAIDVRRFRPSIVLDAGSDGADGAPAGHPELGWGGRRARIGSAEVEFTVPCPRCVMVTREIDAATPTDRSILRHVVRELDQNVGVYADVVTPGAVDVGATVEFV